MRGPSKEQLAAWTAETKRVGFEQRNWSVVHWLAALIVTPLLAGLAASLLNYPPALAAACWVAAAVAGTAMPV
ncbi:hypothetical protein QLH51_16025 [Sphingomonas sp. 2R-10]|uniref:hypothetical protein n=1 Tax=Sphingomonas sp. 2R-10 TaxID=3045148 RepID=UPI000F78C14D|nr:hypothetical protein [Sphingomonas sp. 2R-10]MDJ0278306.1 hypothetical protein [Sphingomonas sp. 2R-10]